VERLDMTNDEQELIDLSSEWAKAMISNDAELIGSFMADDWVIVSERGTSTKEHFLSFVKSGALTHSAFDMVGAPRIKIYGDTAVLTARVTNTAFFSGKRFDADEFTTDVFYKMDRRWLCVLSHITSVDMSFLKEQEK
jgi:ketosteroid isomerase-like protein